MPAFEFEVHKTIKITLHGETKKEARNKIVNHPELYKEEMIKNCEISQGRKVKQ